MKIAICYATGEGHTATVAEHIRKRLAAAGHEIELGLCRKVSAEALQAADGVILGASVHMGKHHKHAVRFARDHQALLAAKPSAFFSVSLTATSDAPEKRAELQGYLDAFQERSGWHPALIEAFAGALLYTKYGFIKRKIMLKIARDEGGDADPSRDYVYTDWDAVDAFADAFSDRLAQ